MDIKNKLLGRHLLELIDDRSVRISLSLSSTSCQERWPRCRIELNNNIKFDDEIVSSLDIDIEEIVLNSITEFKIEIYGKTPKDTVLGPDGEIIENISLHIDKCKINGANIIDNGYINRGKYIMKLEADKKNYYDKHEFPVENNDYHFYENGNWVLTLPVPILKEIIKDVRTLETYETIDYQGLIKEIYKRIT